MKKIFVVISTVALTLTFSSFAFAGNAVSQMATLKGGQHIAECAQKMDNGISKCAQMEECQCQHTEGCQHEM